MLSFIFWIGLAVLSLIGLAAAREKPTAERHQLAPEELDKYEVVPLYSGNLIVEPKRKGLKIEESQSVTCTVNDNI